MNQRRAPQPGDLIADRFRVQALLGRGGMGWALRVQEETSGAVLALKMLDLSGSPKHAKHLTEQFEREFHAMSDLTHPRVVEVYDYGVWNGGPFYTLELLDGGDVQTLAPLPWQDVCSIAYDICSALSLLHSRRLLHRDITPRNIRRTIDGKAKLIDFGLLSPMGSVGGVAGTPPFVAPELVQRGALDARSDLFSLGCTLYYALTGHVWFPARTFSELPELWRGSPAPPSSVVPEIPPVVDELVLALARIDVSLRPKSAAEVMDRLRPLLRAPPDEELHAAQSYLSTPQLFGRESTVLTFREQLARTQPDRGSGFLVVGESGVGRSRMINSFVLEAKVIGATTLRASAVDAAEGPFGVAAALAADLLATQPASALRALNDDAATFGALFRELPQAESGAALRLELRIGHGGPASDRVALQTALRAWFLRAAREHTLAIAVDDVDHIDEPSAAFLASLSWESQHCALAYAFSANTQAYPEAERSHALDVMYEHATVLPLRPLTGDELHALLASVFGDVPNLRLLSTRLYEVCGGRPRDCMALAQHLVDDRIIVYSDGQWTLPAELTTGMLPDHMEEALERRIAALRPLSRRLAVLLACSVLDRLGRSQLLGLPEVTSAEIDRAIEELRANQLISGTTAGYALCDAGIGRLSTARQSAAEIAGVHRELADLFEANGECTLAILHHWLLGDRSEAVIARMAAMLADPQVRIREIDRAETDLGTDRTSEVFSRLLDEAEQRGRPPAELQICRAMLAGMCARGGDAKLYYRVSNEWLAQLKRDSGYDDWQTFGDVASPAERIQRALALAGARHAALPLPQRGMPPGDAIKMLIGYVVMSIAVAVRVLDLRLQRSLPPLLEPFSTLSPLVEAMLWNARATCLNGVGRREDARALFVQVLERIATFDRTQLVYLDKVQAAIEQTVCEIDASLGVDSDYFERLDDSNRDPNHRVGAHYIKKVLALQQGDGDAAERHRRDAELSSLQNKARSMFSTLGQELEAHALARDLTGVKQVRAGIAAMARNYPGWVPVQRVADAHYLRLCGDLSGALEAAASLRVADEVQRESPWCMQAIALEAELLVELRRPLEAIELAGPALAACEREHMPFLARSLARALTLAETALGQLDAALARIEGVIAELVALGVSGIQLERAYECAARIANAASGASDVSSRAAQLAGLSRWGYERASSTVATEIESTMSRIARIMTSSSDRNERARRALELLCEHEQSSEGYLFLSNASGLDLVAAVRNGEPPANLEQFARSWFVSRMMVDSSVQTMADTQVVHGSGDAYDTWISDAGDPYVATFLRTRARSVGVALIRRGERDQSVDRTQFATAVAAHLVD